MRGGGLSGGARVALIASLAFVAGGGCSGQYVRDTTSEVVQATPERVARGKYLVQHVAMCAACHDGRRSGDLLQAPDPELHLAGGNLNVDRGFSIYVPNITSDAGTGVGLWSDDELMRGIRDGVRPDGSFMFPLMPFPSYQHMSDEDVRSVVVYLRSVPKVKQPRPRPELDLPFPVGIVLGLGAMMHEPAKQVPEPDRTDPVEYGEYLAYLGDCTTCHNFTGRGSRKRQDRWLAGSEVPFELAGVGRVWASNLTPHPTAGLGKYGAEQLEASLRSGLRLDGEIIAPPMSLYTASLALLEPSDLDALVAYLRSLPPVELKVPERELEPAWREFLRGQPPETATGPAASAGEVRPGASTGEARPGEAPAGEVERGAALYTSQSCVACHSLDGTARVGPTFRGLFGRTAPLADGSAALVDELHVRESLLRPGARIASGFLPVMPSYEGRLGEEELAALVAYLKTLR